MGAWSVVRCLRARSWRTILGGYDMSQDAKTEAVLNAICFECATAGASYCLPYGRESIPMASPGSRVDTGTTCRECPIAVIRGDGAPISAGKKSKLFPKQLVAGDECEQELGSFDTWLPCFKCERATVTPEDDGEVVELKDLDYCCKFCYAKSLRDGIEEGEAEARMS